ncbi:MAG: hypothetical protein L0H25_02400 [Micrococcales bacterium]|nr:hypothetical protein [Micrococcales bacterium]
MIRNDDVPGVLSLDAVKTYRYLRLSMIGLVVLLGASVGLEWWATGRRCLQESLSAYFFTPAQGVFVGSLVAIGVCLIVIKGNTEWEDLLLNIAGMLAPVVAFVPTPQPGMCRSVAEPMRDASADVANNVGALLIVGVVGMALTIVIARRDRRAGTWNPESAIGVVVALALLAVVGGGYLFARDLFVANAHYVAAVTLFVCIIAVVILNATRFGRMHASGPTARPADFANRYAVIAVLMVIAPLGMLLWRQIFGWDHAVLWIEATEIGLFAIFWLLQTVELWDEGTAPAGPISP